jgi:hypothetical protein
MANIVSVNAYQAGTTPPSKQHNIGVASILDILPFTQTSIPFINSVVYTSNPVLSALYCNDQASAIKAGANAPLA